MRFRNRIIARVFVLIYNDAMKKIVTFGEIMMRLSPKNYRRFSQAQSFDVFYGGAEANVAASLSHFGLHAVFVSKIPEHQIGDAALFELRKNGVDTQFIARGGKRLGIYFAEKGASQRASLILYDRAHSSFQEADEHDFNWDAVFADASFFHFTGITPALGKHAAALCEAACKKAKEKNITVSCDLNYRKKLWTKAEARTSMTRLMPYVDVCIANEEDAANVFGIQSGRSSVERGALDIADYKNVAQKLHDAFHFQKVALTLRSSVNASENKWQALLFDGSQFFQSREYRILIVDRIGGGDAFSAGIIYALANAFDLQKTVEFAAAAGCLQQTIEGDFNLASLDEVLSLAEGNVSGRVKR